MSPPNTPDEAWDDDASPDDAALEAAWSALDDGRPEDALAALETIDPDWPERWIPEAVAAIDLGELPRARQALARVVEFDDVSEHPDYLWARGKLALAEWKLDEAQVHFERLHQLEPSAGACERLSLCAELRGDFGRADELLLEAARLDPSTPPPPRLEAGAFSAVVTQAVHALPREFQRELATAQVVVEAVPGEWMIERDDPSETPPDLLGLFVGSSRLDGNGDASGELPPRIYLFQRNLERACRTHEELVEEIRVTLYHEIGHLLGFDEQGVAGMGLE